MKKATAHYDMLDKLKEVLEADLNVNTVSYGNIYDAANNTTTVWPLSHFTVNSVDMTKQTFRFNMTLFCMDLINSSKDLAEDDFVGNDNVKDIHNTQLAVISKATLLFARRDMVMAGFNLVGDPKFEAFAHEFNQHDVAGWYCDFSVEVIQSMGVGC